MTALNSLVDQYYDGLREVYAGRPLPSDFGNVLNALNTAMQSGEVELNSATETFVVTGGAPPTDIVRSAIDVARTMEGDPMLSAAGVEKNIAELETLLASSQVPHPAASHPARTTTTSPTESHDERSGRSVPGIPSALAYQRQLDALLVETLTPGTASDS